MSYIICENHGGNIGSLVSPEVLQWVIKLKPFQDKVRMIFIQDNNDNRYCYYVDEEFYNEFSNKAEVDLTIPLRLDDDIAFELSLELVPVCPKCLHEWLEN